MRSGGRLADRELEGVETIDVERELPALLAAASTASSCATVADAPALTSTPQARPGRRRARCSRIGFSTATCPGSSSHDFFRSRTT
jgi:hypothetical protein